MRYRINPSVKRQLLAAMDKAVVIDETMVRTAHRLRLISNDEDYYTGKTEEEFKQLFYEFLIYMKIYLGPSFEVYEFCFEKEEAAIYAEVLQSEWKLLIKDDAMWANNLTTGNSMKLYDFNDLTPLKERFNAILARPSCWGIRVELTSKMLSILEKPLSRTQRFFLIEHYNLNLWSLPCGTPCGMNFSTLLTYCEGEDFHFRFNTRESSSGEKELYLDQLIFGAGPHAIVKSVLFEDLGKESRHD